MWQCQTNWPGVSNLALMRVTWPGYAMTVSLNPVSQGSGGVTLPSSSTGVATSSPSVTRPSRLTTSNTTSWTCIGCASPVVL